MSKERQGPQGFGQTRKKKEEALVIRYGVIFSFVASLFCFVAVEASSSKDGGIIGEMEALQLFNEASSLYQKASDLPSAEGEKAYSLYEEAAATYEKVQRGGFEHPDVFYNLGNSYFKVGDLGRAILNYRRAQRLIGNDADLMENIRSAKSKIVDEEPQRGAPELLRIIFFWHFDTTIDFLAKWALYGYFALCVSILANVFVRKPPVLFLIKGFAIVAVVLTASFVIRTLSEPKTAVVLQTSAAVRTGYSQNEGSRFTVHSGTELVVEEVQTAEGIVWYKVALSKELRGWIRADAVGVVQSSPASDPVNGQDTRETNIESKESAPAASQPKSPS